MDKKYQLLMSPLKVGKYIFKNRLLATNAMPHFLQGPEGYPADGTINYFQYLAHNGAAVVDFPDNYDTQEKRQIPIPDICRFPVMDKTDPSVDNYMSQLATMIRYENSIPAAAIRPPEPEGYNVVGGWLTWDENPVPRYFEEIPEDVMLGTLETVAEEAKHYWSLGFRMITMHMAYECTLSARFLTARLNTRTDKYGGSIENRARYPLMLCEAVKKACPDMLVQIIISGDAPNGITLEETVQFAKMAEGKVDLLQLRCETCMASHPTGFNSVKGEHQTIKYAEAVKKSGANIIVVPVGGFHDPDECEAYLREGKADMFGMGRSFICDYDYAKKIQEGRGEDVVPCIRCNKCHVQNLVGPWVSICSVNPEHGIRLRLQNHITAPERVKKVAVIGGGPAGLYAAMTAAKRGHKVTLYEKSNILGGQLYHSDYVSFKWPLKEYKDWLIAQVYKAGVEVKLGVEAVPADIEACGYDAILAAPGAKPNKLPIPGAETTSSPLDVYGNEQAYGPSVIVIGGAETGTETSIHLAECGKTVTVLTRQDSIAPDCDRIHYREYLLERLESLAPGLTFVLQASTKSIDGGKVTYTDAEGSEHTIEADSVILSGGMISQSDEALAFALCAPEFEVIGDCLTVENLQAALRSAYAAASRL